MSPSNTHAKEQTIATVEQEILQAVRSVRYGSVEIIIQDSTVVQIERKEKLRFQQRTIGEKGGGRNLSMT